MLSPSRLSTTCLSSYITGTVFFLHSNDIFQGGCLHKMAAAFISRVCCAEPLAFYIILSIYFNKHHSYLHESTFKWLHRPRCYPHSASAPAGRRVVGQLDVGSLVAMRGHWSIKRKTCSRGLFSMLKRDIYLVCIWQKRKHGGGKINL